MNLRLITALIGAALPLPAFSLTCPTPIADKICVIQALPKGWPDVPLICQQTDASTIQSLTVIANEFPPTLQKIFCGLERIFIVQEHGGSAFGGYISDAAGKPHTLLGINQNVLKTYPTLSDWASWKEQLSFGGSIDPTNHIESLPTIQASLPGVSNDFLFYVLAHEMGHILDFLNHLRAHCDPATGRDCELSEGSFSLFNWETTNNLQPIFNFLGRPGLCFYECNGNFLDWKRNNGIYDRLFKNGFISLYSSTNSADDFAETFAYYIVSQMPGASYQIKTPEGETFYPLNEFRNGILKSKYEFIERTLNRSDLIYGGG